MIIIHGEDTVSARNHLHAEIEKIKGSASDIKRFEARDLDLTILTQSLEGLTLFGQSPTIVIEGIFSLPKSKNKDLLLDFIAKYQDHDVILYENRALTPTILKPFSNSIISGHKPAAIIFTFLDSLKPGNSVRSLNLLTKLEDDRQPAELIFAMLVRQIRLLIQALEPANLKSAPWQKNKLISQARAFGEERLLKIHSTLYKIDKDLKTGRNPLDLSTQIFSLVANL